MADLGITGLKNEVDVQIYTNHAQAITGAIMNDTLIDTIDTLKNGGNLDAKSVDTAQLADGAVEALQIATGAVTEAKIGTGAVETAKIKDLNVTTSKLAAKAVTSEKLADDAVVRTFAGAVLLNPYSASLTPRRVGDIAINTTSGEIWQATAITNAAASWNCISAGFYGGKIITNWDTHAQSGDITSYGNATGAPTSTESFYGHHINSNAGTANAVQWAIGYTTHKIYIRTKTASTWGAWSTGITATELGYLSGATSNIQSQIDGVKTNIAPEWVANTSYTWYDFVRHNNILYMCISTHSDATWIEGHWLAKDVGKALTSNYQDHDDISSQLSGTAVALDTTVDNFATEWRSNYPYVIGELVIREYILYRCKTANNDSVWTASKWTQISIGEEISNIQEQLNSKLDMHEFDLFADLGKNKFDNTKLLESCWINSRGDVYIQEEGFVITRPIKISAGYWTLSGFTDMQAGFGYRYSVKDAGGVTLLVATLESPTTVINAPAGSATIQFGYQRPGSELYGLLCQLESGSVATAYEPYGYTIEESKIVPNDEFIYTLPSTINVAVGRQCNIYKDNFSDRIPDRSSYFETTFTKRTSDSQFLDMQRCARYSPTTVKAVTTDLKIRKGLNGTLLSKSMIFNAVSKTAGSNTKNVLYIGDSLSAYGVITGEILALFTADGGGAISLMGHIGAGLNKYEARGGWSFADYATNTRKRYYLNVVGFNVVPDIVNNYIIIGTGYYRIDKYSLDGSGNGTLELTSDSGTATVTESGTFTYTGTGATAYNYSGATTDQSGNPFWSIADGALNFTKYMTDYNAGANLDVVVIQHGINDIYSNPASDIATAIANATAIKNAIVSAYPNCKIIFSLEPFAPYLDGYSGLKGHNELLTYRKNMFALYAGLIALEGGNVSIAYSNLWIDRLYGYAPTEKAANSRTELTIVENGGGVNDVHPSTEGSYQIADCIYSQIRAIL